MRSSDPNGPPLTNQLTSVFAKSNMSSIASRIFLPISFSLLVMLSPTSAVHSLNLSHFSSAWSFISLTMCNQFPRSVR